MSKSERGKDVSSQPFLYVYIHHPSISNILCSLQGFHCVLCLRAEDLTRPGVGSLTPIVLLINPRKGFKIKLHAGLGQVGNSQPASYHPEQIRELGRKYKLYITGEYVVCNTVIIAVLRVLCLYCYNTLCF